MGQEELKEYLKTKDTKALLDLYNMYMWKYENHLSQCRDKLETISNVLTERSLTVVDIKWDYMEDENEL